MRDKEQFYNKHFIPSEDELQAWRTLEINTLIAQALLSDFSTRLAHNEPMRSALEHIAEEPDPDSYIDFIPLYAQYANGSFSHL